MVDGDTRRKWNADNHGQHELLDSPWHAFSGPANGREMLSGGVGLTNSSRSDRREGFTLAEVVLTLVLAGLVLGVVTATGVRLQRQLASEGTRLASGDQMAAAAAVLPPDLRAL